MHNSLLHLHSTSIDCLKPIKKDLRAMSKNTSLKQRKKLLMRQRRGTGSWKVLQDVCHYLYQ